VIARFPFGDDRGAVFLVYPFAQENLDERLVWHITLVCQLAQFVEHELGQAQGDGARGWFEVGENGPVPRVPCPVLEPGLPREPGLPPRAGTGTTARWLCSSLRIRWSREPPKTRTLPLRS